MYEAMNRSIPDVAGYLERIGLDGPPPVDLKGLNALVWAHQTHVPFEDITVHRDKETPVPGDPRAVRQDRGAPPGGLLL